MHFYEEPCISGTKGSGTVFFSNCNLKCVYCQNYEISQENTGEEITVEKLAKTFLKQQENGAHNINLVSPTPYVTFIIDALKIAKENGLKIPVIYNTSGYEKVETLKMLEIYDDLGRDILAIPFTKGRKTDKEKFAGALETYSIEALMPDGKALQSGTTHYFGTGFAEAFGIKFQGRDGKLYNPHQTSWGVSTRLLGAIIMVHGDDNGLSLPPYVAPIQAVVIPVAQQKPGVIPAARELERLLKDADIRVKLDESDKTPGWKYSEYEMKGVPLRIEIGPRDIEAGVVTIAVRHDGRKITVKKEEMVDTVKQFFKQIHQEMYQKAYAYLLDHVTEVTNLDGFNKAMDKGGYAKMMWCGEQACEDAIKEKFTATARCLPFNQMLFSDTCPVCGKKAKKVVLFAKAY